MSRRIKPGNERDDGSNGEWTSGFPTSVVGKPNPQIDYDAQAGAPVGYPGHGGTHKPNVPQRSGQVPRSPDPSPFKVGK